MQWTPEAVKAEMDYRREVARRGATPEHIREARRQHPSLWRRVREHHAELRAA